MLHGSAGGRSGPPLACVQAMRTDVGCPNSSMRFRTVTATFISVAGTVNLIGSGHDKAHEARSHEGLCPSGHAGDRGPGLEGLGPGGSILAGRAVIAAEMEQVVDLIVSGEEALGLAG